MAGYQVSNNLYKNKKDFKIIISKKRLTALPKVVTSMQHQYLGRSKL